MPMTQRKEPDLRAWGQSQLSRAHACVLLDRTVSGPFGSLKSRVSMLLAGDLLFLPPHWDQDLTATLVSGRVPHMVPLQTLPLTPACVLGWAVGVRAGQM